MIYEQMVSSLNTNQRRAVETIDGPVMVVAGPGTGKTQVLALRIAHILKHTDTAPNAILCLTFTRSGVEAMRNRLEKYIGSTARQVTISTFHSFAIGLIEKYYELLDFTHIPKLMDDTDTIGLVDTILENETWQYLRPRTDPSKYFNDVRGLISILKRERITPEDFLLYIQKDIENLKDDPNNISSRGATKGQLKQEILKKIEGLERTQEVVLFYRKYEEAKKTEGLMDYDDVLEYIVFLGETYEDVRADIRENYLYVLVDEHQDSSGVQNAFLKSIWKDTELPNIFVVGDDRQLIYGFSGANVDYFTEFKTCFGTTQMITLTENYRSTEPILKLADQLLSSSITKETLHSNTPGEDKTLLSEFHYSSDEIIGAGLYFKKQLSQNTIPETYALLVPKNSHVRQAVSTLRNLGLEVYSEIEMSLLQIKEAQSLVRVLEIIADPTNPVLLTEALLDETSGVPTLDAHVFLKNIKNPSTVSIALLREQGNTDGLFAGENPILQFGNKLSLWIEELSHSPASVLVSVIGNELLIDQSHTHESLIKSIEIVRSFIHHATLWEEKKHNQTLRDFILYLQRLTTYGNTVSMRHFGVPTGISVMTLHKSKGLEYDHVWIAHMNEEVLMSQKPHAFSLPEKVKEKLSERDILTAKRELYVAITRAKKQCVISYAHTSDKGGDMNLLEIIGDLDDQHFIKTSRETNETNILLDNPRHYALKPFKRENILVKDLSSLVRDRFTETKISVSMLNNFFTCPWKWYFRNFLRLPEAKTTSLVFGSVVHKTIESILKDSHILGESQIKNTILEHLVSEGVYDTKEQERLSHDAYSAVQNWIDVYYPHLAKNTTTERSLTFRDPEFPNLLMYGKIDLTERFPDGHMVITDFKTGGSKTVGSIEKRDEEGRLSDYMRQLAMYSYLVRGTEDTHVDESRLLFIEEDIKNKNALYKTQIGTEEINSLVNDIKDYQSLLLSGEWVDRPCYNTGYGKQTECEYCKKIEKILGK